MRSWRNAYAEKQNAIGFQSASSSNTSDLDSMLHSSLCSASLGSALAACLSLKRLYSRGKDLILAL